MKKTLILQCPGMVCSPPVVSKCLGEAHRRLELFTLFTLFTLHYIKSSFFSILLVITKQFDEHTCHFCPACAREASGHLGRGRGGGGVFVCVCKDYAIQHIPFLQCSVR